MVAQDTSDNASFAPSHVCLSASHSGKPPFATSFVRNAFSEILDLKCESKLSCEQIGSVKYMLHHRGQFGGRGIQWHTKALA